jgi:2-polyprenyl-3-methyl-5-hydroxy-6-metoxy-1,4-benzoquinol methylase
VDCKSPHVTGLTDVLPTFHPFDAQPTPLCLETIIMSTQTLDLLERMRRQYDNAPYPKIPLEEFPKNSQRLYIHSLTTAYYRQHQRVISPVRALILDAGCGTGYKSLELAIANPGAKIVGIDLSEASVNLARQRLAHHGIDNVEFHAMALEDLPKLGMQFDYINNDEVLYLLPNPISGLRAMQQVLKPDGIIRTNFHSSLQRVGYFRAQSFFKQLGLMNGAPPETDVELVRQTMKYVKNGVLTKASNWDQRCEEEDEIILANYLLDGDKGWTILEFFSALRSANLSFISMVNWREWNLPNLFSDRDKLPPSIRQNLFEKSLEEQLHLFELLNPVHRLLDIWCGNLGELRVYTPVKDWTESHWRNAKVALHPLLSTSDFKAGLVACSTQLQPLQLNNYLHISSHEQVQPDSLGATCLLPLLDGSQPLTALVQRWLQIRPVDPVTLAPTPEEDAFNIIKMFLQTLEEMGYVLLECVD